MEPLALGKVQNSRTKNPSFETWAHGYLLITLKAHTDYLCKSTCRHFKSEAHLLPAVLSKCHHGPAIVPIPPSIY